jgi:hypothetical protein
MNRINLIRNRLISIWDSFKKDKCMVTEYIGFQMVLDMKGIGGKIKCMDLLKLYKLKILISSKTKSKNYLSLERSPLSNTGFLKMDKR